MSATMNLYTIAKNVTYIPGLMHSYKPSQYTMVSDMFDKEANVITAKYENDSISFDDMDNELRELCKKYFGYYSDNNDHDEFMFYHYRGRSNRVKNYFKTAKALFADYIQHGRGTYDDTYLILDSIEYAQGWFFSKKLFKSKNSTFYAFDKVSAKRLLDNMIRLHYPHDNRGSEAYHRFLNAIEKLDEPFILEISW